jgi:hypothetical protein
MTVMTPDQGCSPLGTTCAMRTRIHYQWSALAQTCWRTGPYARSCRSYYLALHMSWLSEG